MLAGVLLLGLATFAQSAISFTVIRRMEYAGTKEKIAGVANAYFAFCQLILGIAAVFGAVSEAVANYVSSGAFWRNALKIVSPNWFIFLFGSFLMTTGIAQILSRLPYRNQSWKDFLEGLSENLHGIFFLFFGFIFAGLIVFLWIAQLFEQ